MSKMNLAELIRLLVILEGVAEEEPGLTPQPSRLDNVRDFYMPRPPSREYDASMARLRSLSTNLDI